MPSLLALSWNLQYLFGRTRWDTGVTPPELIELIEGGRIPPGRALDVGCGTGTNSIYLAKHGFDVVGIDVAALAVRKARRKAKKTGAAVQFIAGNVLTLGAEFGEFDLALDIGCLHSLLPSDRRAYGETVRRLLRPGSSYVLYAWGPRTIGGHQQGLSRQELEDEFGDSFEVQWVREGEEGGAPSYWYWFKRAG